MSTPQDFVGLALDLQYIGLIDMRTAKMTLWGPNMSHRKSLPPTVQRLLPCYCKLATGLGYVPLREMVSGGDYGAVREAIEREYVEQPEGWYFTTTRMGDDIQIQVD